MSHAANLASYKDQSIWIIGASSGIGYALAELLAQQEAKLALSSRRAEALEELRIKLSGSGHHCFPCDLLKADDVQTTAEAIKQCFGNIDRVIILAAAYEPMKLTAIDLQAMRHIVEVNLIGSFNVLHAILPLLFNQNLLGNHRAQIALCGSVSAYTGLPNGQPYSATKAAITNLAESLYAEVGDKIDVKLISPGFVKTPLTEKNDFEMPGIISPEQAAQAIAKGLQISAFEIHFPKRITLFLKLIKLLPYRLSFAITRRFQT